MSVPTEGETYAKILEHLIKLQEETATMSHIVHANDRKDLARAWIAVSENFKKMQQRLTLLAMGRLS
jgi:hypothetical protein